MTLLGPSGCGKTTTLRMLAGLEHPTAGRILIGGKDVTMLPANERDVSMVFQSYALVPAYVGARERRLRAGIIGDEEEGGARTGGRGAEAGRSCRLWASGCPPNSPAASSSASPLPAHWCSNRRCCLLDEPLSNLDARLRRRVRTEIRELQQRLGFTAVYVTHDQEEALAVSDRIIVMQDGVIAQQGSPRELYEAPASSFIADFIGEANVVPCEVLRSRWRAGDHPRRQARTSVPGRSARPGPAKLAVRPNAITLEAAEARRFSRTASRHAAYLGDHVEYEVETEAGTLFVVDPAVDRNLAPATECQHRLSAIAASPSSTIDACIHIEGTIS